MRQNRIWHAFAVHFLSLTDFSQTSAPRTCYYCQNASRPPSTGCACARPLRGFGVACRGVRATRYPLWTPQSRPRCAGSWTQKDIQNRVVLDVFLHALSWRCRAPKSISIHAVTADPVKSHSEPASRLPAVGYPATPSWISWLLSRPSGGPYSGRCPPRQRP